MLRFPLTVVYLSLLPKVVKALLLFIILSVLVFVPFCLSLSSTDTSYIWVGPDQLYLYVFLGKIPLYPGRSKATVCKWIRNPISVVSQCFALLYSVFIVLCLFLYVLSSGSGVCITDETQPPVASGA